MTDARVIPALVVKQWRAEWEEVPWNPASQQRRPEPTFLMFSVTASTLKALTGVYRRSTAKLAPRSRDLNVQRAHDESRSEKIRDYVKYGYPWSDLPERRRNEAEFRDLRKPGWLPTALVVNILRTGDERNGKTLDAKDAMVVRQDGARAEIALPASFSGSKWKPKSIPPLEVIDGQHRLWAFDDMESTAEFELPVVAFNGLDRSWQAYLFWTVNITPKKIAPSLAFDLYPMLRTETWLDSVSGVAIYRETRAQELVESLWSSKESPWFERINMLGESGLGSKMVTQAAWIRSLMATFVKPWEGHGRGKGIGGLFGARIDAATGVLTWTRGQQSAFLIAIWIELKRAVAESKAPWAKGLRVNPGLFPIDDPAFYGESSLINSDQGVRGVLSVFNDMFFVASRELQLMAWKVDRGEVEGADTVRECLASLSKKPAIRTFMAEVATRLAEQDWRTSAAPGLSEAQRLKQAVFRGGPGYKELKVDRLRTLALSTGAVGKAARTIIDIMGY